jgi:hypothetical protein
MASTSLNGLSSSASTQDSTIETNPKARSISPANALLSPDLASTSTKQTSGPLDDLRNLRTSLRQARVLRRINQGQMSALNRVNEKKREVQKVAASYEELRNGAAIDSVLPGSEHFLFERNREIERRFSAGEPAFVRTLRYTSDEEAVAKSRYGGGKTLAKRELDTLMNNVPGLDIVATPSTLIGAQFKASIRSHIEKKKSKGLPSAVFMPLAVNASAGQHTLQLTGSRRPGFGDVQNFRSSRAFSFGNYVDVAPSLSHAERFDVLEKNSKQFIRPDSTRPRKGFSHSAQELVDDLMASQAADPSRVLRPNEYFAKLELWDAKAVEVGDKKDVAIATLIEFNVEMASLERSLSREGANDPTLTDHLRRQLAWPTDQSKEPLDLSGVESKLSKLGEPEIETYLDGVLGQLRDRVTLCTYQHGETGSALRTLAFRDFSREEILSGIKRYLDARLPSLPNQG